MEVALAPCVASSSVRLPCNFRVCAAVGCSCCCVTRVASVVARRVRAVVVRLALDSLVVVFLVWRTVVVALPSRLRCIAWLPCVLVRFPRTVCCCSGEGFSQDYSVLVSVVAVLPQGLSMMLFWLVRSGGFSQNGALVVLVEVLPGPACVAPAVLLTVVFSLMVRVLPRIALCRFWRRFFPGILCVRFGPPLCCPCGSKCAPLW
ncbi:hypothetical protein Taro_026003 [Colocasia esculenta]|uniref:Uncharacterized protein n=1 Tax=Colocasia esculenta TaxID=4460 RepID=A0A843VFV1_COLES|nr:hypothetical protein [Colocasia esculenta]